MPRFPDYSDLYDMYDRERQEEIDRLPVCDYCNKPIVSDYLYDINEELICESCMHDHFRKDVDLYVDN
jgi:formylmethanofuran dehydrogenase subunit E